MKHVRKIINSFILFGCLILMSFTNNETVGTLDPDPQSRLLGWSNMSCVPSGNGAIELNCKQCYFILFIAVDCRECINYVGASTNRDCKDL